MRPIKLFGGDSPGGLRLPPAKASRRNLYGPRGVTIHGNDLIVCDTGNHRVLIYKDFVESGRYDADIVIGQDDFDSERHCSSEAKSGLYMPTQAEVIDNYLVVADSWHHRLVVFDYDSNGEPSQHAICVIGQNDLNSIDANQGSNDPSANSLYWPFGFVVLNDSLFVADTGNRRVLAWSMSRFPDLESARLVLGQNSMFEREENRGELAGDTFRWPHALDGTEEMLFVADAGNHRVLGFNQTKLKEPAQVIIGQTGPFENSEWPYGPQSATKLRFPYGLSVDKGRLAVADTANNRVLIYRKLPRGYGEGADHVLGQVNFEQNGENRWQTVASDTFCWPYGVDMVGNLLAVADSGNNRVAIWKLEE